MASGFDLLQFLKIHMHTPMALEFLKKVTLLFAFVNTSLTLPST